jgi:hypothetical protein
LTLSRTVITPVCLSWLEEASIAGGNGYWRSQGFGLGENWAGGGRTRARVSSWGIYKLQRRASSRIGVRRGRQRGREEEHGVEVASSARRGWGRPPPVVLFSEGVSWATVWWWSGPSVGLLLGSDAGLRWPGELFFLFLLFSIFCFQFCFIILLLISNLNHMLPCRYQILNFSRTIEGWILSCIVFGINILYMWATLQTFIDHDFIFSLYFYVFLVDQSIWSIIVGKSSSKYLRVYH